MRKCYTISGLKSLYELPKMDCVQVTLNGRQFPAKRRTVAALQSLRESGVKTPIIIHYDFIYVISRYAMFKDSVQEAIMEEITGLLLYADSDPNTLGIIMHTDWPIKKEFQFTPDKNQFITDNYQGSLWDLAKIRNLITGDMVESSILKFVEDLTKHYEGKYSAKVFLENTTKVGPKREGTLQWILDLFVKHPNLSSVLGVVYDTEHHYAVTGEWLSVDDIIELNNNIPMIVHLNTVPSEVKPCSGKDRHSETTTNECSVNTKSYYEEFACQLDSANIPWVREVKEDTMFREMNDGSN